MFSVVEGKEVKLSKIERFNVWMGHALTGIFPLWPAILVPIYWKKKNKFMVIQLAQAGLWGLGFLFLVAYPLRLVEIILGGVLEFQTSSFMMEWLPNAVFYVRISIGVFVTIYGFYAAYVVYKGRDFNNIFIGKYVRWYVDKRLEKSEVKNGKSVG